MNKKARDSVSSINTINININIITKGGILILM